MGMGGCMVTPPRPSWDLAMGLGMEKPKAVAECLLAGYREWTVKGFKGQEPKFTSIDPDNPAGRFDELVGRVSHISKENLEKSLIGWPDHERVTRIRTAAIVAEMKQEIQSRMNEVRMNLIPVVSADAVSWGSEVDSYGRNRPVQRAWIVVPAYLAAVPDFFSLIRTVWPGDITLKIRDNIFKHLKEGTSSKMGDASSMSESEDAEMTSAVQGGPPVGENPGGSHPPQVVGKVLLLSRRPLLRRPLLRL